MLLTDVIGLSWAKAHDEAERLEHAISPEVEELLLKRSPTRKVAPMAFRCAAALPNYGNKAQCCCPNCAMTKRAKSFASMRKMGASLNFSKA